MRPPAPLTIEGRSRRRDPGDSGPRLNGYFSPAANTWTKRSEFPHGSWAKLAGVIDGRLYVIGGVSDSGTQAPAAHSWDPATNTWESGAALITLQPGDGVPGTALTTYQGQIYLLGGHKSSEGWVYDPQLDW